MYKSSNNLTKDTFKLEVETVSGESFAVSVFPPSLANIRSLQGIDQNSDTALEDTIECVSKIISRNKEGRTFSSKAVEDLFDIFDISDFITDFVSWIDNIKKK